MGPISARLFSSMPKRYPLLEKALSQVLNKSIQLHKESFGIYKATMDKGIVAEIYPGGSFEPTTVFVTDGKNTIGKEISSSWLDNWHITKIPTKLNHK